MEQLHLILRFKFKCISHSSVYDKRLIKFTIFAEDLCLVGVKSGKVEDEDMTASSVFDDYYAAHEGRWDRTDGGGNYWQPPAHRWRMSCFMSINKQSINHLI